MSCSRPGNISRSRSCSFYPLSALIWITGVIAFLAAPRFKPYRFLGWAYLVSFAVFVDPQRKELLSRSDLSRVSRCRMRRDRRCHRSSSGRSWLKPAMVALLLAGGAIFAPLAMPILPIDQFIPYMQLAAHQGAPQRAQPRTRGCLPQHYADQFGWNEIVDEVVVAWNQIPAEERKDCGIFRAGLRPGRSDRFPRAENTACRQSLSGHQSWWLWGPRGYSGNCLIVLDDNRERLEELFEQRGFCGHFAATTRTRWSNGLPVFICRGAKFGTLAQALAQLKRWR